MASQKSSALKTGDLVQVAIEKVVHGGHFIARHDGAVIFVRHAIPGENCTIQITSVGKSFNRADVVSIETPSEFRVIAPCSFAHRNGCGGCDFQHISVDHQRKLKSDVITEQFSRIAKIELQIEVEEVDTSTHWRTRAIATTDRDGKLGFFKSRSHSIAPVTDCLICVEDMNFSQIASRDLKGGSNRTITFTGGGTPFVNNGIFANAAFTIPL